MPPMVVVVVWTLPGAVLACWKDGTVVPKQRLVEDGFDLEASNGNIVTRHD